jgi:hypothetical protein
MILILLYAAAIVSANLLVAVFGPAISPINAFFLIGLDLALRNVIGARITPLKMGALIAGTGVLSYAINPASGIVAIASGVAFTVAALADWVTFQSSSGSWLRRNFYGNSVGAALDSVIFSAIAFGSVMPVIALAQIAAKIAGGATWGYVMNRVVK